MAEGITPRPRILCADSGPTAPYPLEMEGTVISGFGRGSKELGIPTANLPVDSSKTPWIADARSGVYFGWASLALPDSHPDKSSTKFQIYPMVMSIGYNPFYNNSVRSAEVHVLYKFAADFYDAPMRLLIMGYVRDERNYDGLDALIEDIQIDCDVARQSLARSAWTPSEGVVGQENAKGTFDGAWLVR